MNNSESHHPSPLFHQVDLPYLAYLPSLPVPAFPGPLRDVDDGYLTFYLDNDLFGGTDENYTNGARLSWISRNRELNAVPAVQRSLARFSGLGTGEELYYNYGFSLTQLMFTPEDIFSPIPPSGERPYGGWLGAGFSLHAKNDQVLNSAEISVGIAGPSSFAETAQDFIHSLRDIEKANGWDTQLENELTVNFHLVQKRKLHDVELFGGLLSCESFTEWGVDVGNLRTAAHVGAQVRVGYQLPVDFSSPKLDVTAYGHQIFGKDEEREGKLGFFLFGGVEAEVVGYDLFLDGSLFQEGPGVDREPFIGEVSFGAGVSYGRLTVSYAHTYRTAEFATQNDDQYFGSLGISLAF